MTCDYLSVLIMWFGGIHTYDQYTNNYFTLLGHNDQPM